MIIIYEKDIIKIDNLNEDKRYCTGPWLNL